MSRVAGVGPDGDKGRMSEGHLTAIADQELDAQGPHNGIGHQIGHADPDKVPPSKGRI